MKKLFRITTIPLSLNLLLKNQLHFLNQYYEVTAVSSEGVDLTVVREREEVKTLAINMEREIKVFKDLISLAQLIRSFLKFSPEIVHSNTPKASLLAMLAAKVTSVPYRFYTITGLRFETEKGLKKHILIWMERITCFCATHVIAESKGVQKMIVSNNLTKRNTVIIGNGNINGIDQDFWDPQAVTNERKDELRKVYDLTSDDFIFIFVGRLVTSKGINELVQAFQQLNQSNYKLLLLGDEENVLDPLQSDTLKIIANNKSIIRTGFQNNVRDFLAISNVLVLPSYREGFPNVILQAGAMGIPCIVTDVNGAEDVIDGRNGKIVVKRNIQELKAAMSLLEKKYTDFDSTYCRNKIISDYSQKFYYPELLKFYREVVD